MYTYQDYLNFNTAEDKARQIQIFDQIHLSTESHLALKTLAPQTWLILAEPFCPDCLVFVPIIEKMANTNPNITLRYVPRSQIDNDHYFDNAEQHALVKHTHAIPSAFLITHHTQVAYKEFPEELKQEMLISPENYQNLKQAYRQGKYQTMIEKQLIHIMKKA